MQTRWTVFISAWVFSLILAGFVHAEVDGEIFRTIPLKDDPVP